MIPEKIYIICYLLLFFLCFVFQSIIIQVNYLSYFTERKRTIKGGDTQTGTQQRDPGPRDCKQQDGSTRAAR